MASFIRNLVCTFSMVIFMSWSAYGQQWNQSSLTAVNPYREYAAYAGFDKSISIAAALRNQWVSLPGSPSFFYTGVHLPLYLYNVGTGIDLQGASDGVLKFRMARVSAGKALGVAGGTLSLAGRVGFTQITIDGNAIRTPEGDYTDGVIDHQDAALSNSSYAGTGLYWEGSVFFRNERWQAGLSVSDWPKHDVGIQNSVFGLNTQLSAFFQWQYDFSQNIQFQPNLVLRTDFVSTQTEINALMRINGNIFGGVMLRGYSSSSLDALGFSIGHKIDRRYTVFYNYDAGISSLKRSNEGSHELILKVSFYNLPATGIPPKIIYNPRFLE